MTKRLLQGEGTEFERELLGAIAAEKPSAALEARMREALGLSGAATVAPVAATAAWVKPLIAGAVASGIAIGVAVGLSGSDAPKPPESARAAVAPALAPKPPEPAPAEVPAVAPEAAPQSPPALEVAAERTRTLPAKASHALRQEILLLDRARSAVHSGDTRLGLRLLQQYERRYPRGEFRQEALVLRVTALERSGKTGEASALGRKFIADHPESPHVQQVERVTGK